jgi:ubiquinone/menaquinone biosynthesis C-methylase UbiE
MNSTTTDPPTDIWSDWLLHHRHGGDAGHDRVVRSETARFADRVLGAAHLTAGMTLADIGAGDGLVAFAAIDRIGPSLRVILTDISAPLLRRARAIATERNIAGQCTFLQCPADHLKEIPDASVDVVTTRAALAYVPDRPAALREFHRILKPGGRISFAEPIFQDEALETLAVRKLLMDSPGATHRFFPLLHRWKSAQFPDTRETIAATAIVNFSERDLLRFVNSAGFEEIHLELHIDVRRSKITSWDVFIATSPHPLAPPLRTILAERFSAEERTFFEKVLRPIVESGQAISTDRVVYLQANKPQSPNSFGEIQNAVEPAATEIR